MLRENMRIIAWNVNSIRSKSKQEEVTHLLSEYKPDLLLLSETKLKNCNSVKFPNYKIYRNDRLFDGGGGTAILIKESIKHVVVNTPLLKSSEATSVKIFLGNAKSVVINSFYCPKILLRHDLLKLMNLHTKVFMGGDFNAKNCYWHNAENNGNGNNLYRFLIDDNVADLIHPNEYTCYRSERNPSTIDLALAKDVEVVSSRVTEFNPDHCPVEYVLKFDENVVYETPTEHFMYNRANWDKFKEIVVNELTLRSCRVENEIDSQVLLLTEAIRLGMTQSIPKKSFTSKNHFDPETMFYIRRKKILRRVYFRSNFKDPEIKAEIRRLDRAINDSIKSRDSKILMNKLKQIKPNNKMYQNINKLIGLNSKVIPEMKMSDGSMVSNPADKANMIATEFGRIHEQNRSMGDPEFDEEVTSEICSFLLTTVSTSSETLLTDADEISYIIAKLKNKKSTGPDTIPNIVLKKLPSQAHAFMAKMINQILSSGKFPTSWKTAHVIPIPKPGKPANEVKNLRPISLLNCLSKVLERVLHVRIIEFCNENDLLPNNQFGFRKGHSTVHALLRFYEEAIMGFNDRKTTIAAFLDIEKAFDTMWVEGLIFKMINMKFPSYLTKIMLSYLKDRKFRVKLGDQLSDAVSVNDGVPQGSILGPLLFIIFMIDLPTHMNTTLTIFADDTNTLSSRQSQYRAKSNVQSHLSKLHRYYEKWKIKVNAGKSEAMLIQRSNCKRQLENFPALKINDTEIPYKRSVRYLGYYVQTNLKHNEHINRMLLKAHSGLHKLYPILKANNGISQEVKIKTYKTILRPVLTYAVGIWHNLPKYLIKRLKVFENKCLRLAINFRRSRRNFKFISTEELHKVTKIPRLNIHLYDLAKNMLSKTYSHDNSVISNFGKFSNERITNILYKPPHTIVRSTASKLLSI